MNPESQHQGASSVLFVFFYQSPGDTFRFPGLFACCCGELKNRGVSGHVVEVCLDVQNREASDAAMAEFAAMLADLAPAVIVLEDVFEPEVFEIVRRHSNAQVVSTQPSGVFPEGAVDVSVDFFATNPAVLVDVVQRIVKSQSLAGLPNVATAEGFRSTETVKCGLPPLFVAEPDYDFIRLPVAASRPSDRLSVYVNPGCPWSSDVQENPLFAGVDLSNPGISRKGCSFCHQDGEYRGLDATGTVNRIIFELECWRRRWPDCREIVIWDESPWRFLPGLVEEVGSRRLGPLVICFHARADHLVRQAGRIEEACQVATRHSSAGVSLALTLVGFENYSQAELSRMNKGMSPSVLTEAASVCRRIADEWPDVFEYDRFKTSSFILFTPWTTAADLIANTEGFNRDNILEFSTGMGLTKLRLYPNLPIYHLAVRDGLTTRAGYDRFMNSARRFGYASDYPWRFKDERIEYVYRVYEALYPLVERNEQVDLLEWCLNAVFSASADQMDARVAPEELSALFVRLKQALAHMNGSSVVQQAGQPVARQSGHSRTLELVLSGPGLSRPGNLPDMLCDPSPSRLAVRIARYGSGADLIHVIGREPTMSPVFLRAVYLARQSGIPKAVVRTDGIVFSDPSAMARAIRAGLTDIEMRIFGFDRSSWLHPVSGQGAFDRSMEAAAMIGASSSVINGRALVQLGPVPPDRIPDVRKLVLDSGLPRISWESPIIYLPFSGLKQFVTTVEEYQDN